MKNYHKIMAILLSLQLLWQGLVLAAPSYQINNIRFSQTPAATRIVFDCDKVPEYKINILNNGLRIVISFSNTVNLSKIKTVGLNDAAIKTISVTESGGATTAIIDLNYGVAYKVNSLKNPERFYIDIIKGYEQKLQENIAPGVEHKTIIKSNEKGNITAHIIDIAPTANYKLKPILSNEMITGLETVSSMSSRNKALAAINASYFNKNGEILGLTKIDGKIISATGLTRSAVGLLPDNKLLFGQIDYNGMVRLPNGKILAITGINCERGENGVVIYNKYYDSSTNTNEFGKEYVLQDNKVIAINNNNSSLRDGQVVLSVHGTAMEQFNTVQVGDIIQINESINEVWNKIDNIVGVGPMLIKNNSIYISSKQEQFGSDVAGGKAPRTAIGLTKDNHILLVVVDGRQSHSAGMTLLELALFMQENGAVQALNFDGGGSSEMVINNNIINKPSDGKERKVTTALAIVKK